MGSRFDTDECDVTVNARSSRLLTAIAGALLAVPVFGQEPSKASGLMTIADEARPRPSDIVRFDITPRRAGIDQILPIYQSPQFKGFRVQRKDLDRILLTWVVLPRYIWEHRYSHVMGGDRTGTIRLRDGRKVDWYVKPGGLASLHFPTGKVLYLAECPPSDYSGPMQKGVGSSGRP